MRILFDNNVDARFANLLIGHEVRTAFQMGWADFKNGLLINVAEEHGFPVIISADKNLSYQQNLKGRKISILILGSKFADFKSITPLADEVLSALEALPPGSFVFVGKSPSNDQ